MSRFISWLAVAIAAAFLVVASVSFSGAVTAALAFGIGIGTLVVSMGLAYRCRSDVPSLVLGIAGGAVSAFMIAASLAFSDATAQTLALAGSLALSAIAVAGLTAHEFENDYVVQPRQRQDEAPERTSALAAAA